MYELVYHWALSQLKQLSDLTYFFYENKYSSAFVGGLQHVKFDSKNYYRDNRYTQPRQLKFSVVMNHNVYAKVYLRKLPITYNGCEFMNDNTISIDK